jgi:hypothetical protein
MARTQLTRSYKRAPIVGVKPRLVVDHLWRRRVYLIAGPETSNPKTPINLNAIRNSDWIALRFVELSSKLLNVLPRRLPVGIAGIAMELEATSTQRGLKFVASKGNGLVMIVWTCDFKLGHCGHSLGYSLREKIRLRQPRDQHGNPSTRVRMRRV